MPRVEIERLRAAMLARAAGFGLDDERAALLVDHMLDAELRGLASHGVQRVRWVSQTATFDPGARPRLVERRDGHARYDGGGCLGYLALAEVLDRELTEPPEGARLVVVSRCFPTGRLGWYGERIARGGFVGMVTATSTARIAHPAGGPPVTGTNPVCLALPDDPEPVVIDVSMGRITYGDVLVAAAGGLPLPEGTAIRADGTGPEHDPGEVTAGRAGIAPFGGEQAHKGFALALAVELLCRALGGEQGHTAVVLLARPQAAPVAGLRAAIGDRHFPGDGGRDRRAAARAAGSVDLPADLWAWLSQPG